MCRAFSKMSVNRWALSNAGSQPQRVQIVALDLVDLGEQGLQVLADAQMAPGQAIRLAAGQREDQADGPLRVGAASRVELVSHPAVDTACWGLPVGRAAQRCPAQADAQQARVDTEYGH